MKKRGAKLGQHFLTGAWAAAKLVEAARIGAEDTVLEIGPGKGALTKEILKTGARVIAIEKDPLLVEYLRENFPHENLKVLEMDIRDALPEKLGLSAGSYILAANIPYYITGEIIRQFLSALAQPRTMALLVQKEVAERIIARDKKESILSLSVHAYGDPSIAAKVARGNFSPPPSVDSAILLVERISKDFFDGFDEQFFFRLVRAGFASKRKFLLKNLASLLPIDAVRAAFELAGIDEKVRAEDVRLAQWKTIARKLNTAAVTSETETR